jgi:hypothetical protein
VLADQAALRLITQTPATSAVALARMLVWLAGGLLGAALVAMVVQAHRAVGTTAFWMTRPIQPRVLVLSKLALLGGLLIGVPIAAEAMVMAAYSVPVKDALLVVLQTAFTRGIVLAILLAVAALTSSFARFVVACAAILLGLALVTSLGVTLALSLQDDAAALAVLKLFGSQEAFRDPARAIVGALMLAVASLSTFGTQYAWRSTRRTLAVAACGLAAACITAALWPWPTFRREVPAPAWAQSPSALSLRVDDGGGGDGLRLNSGGPAGNEPRSIVGHARLRVDGAPAGWFVSATLAGASVDLDGRGVLVSQPSEGPTTLPDASGTSTLRQALRHVLGAEATAEATARYPEGASSTVFRARQSRPEGDVAVHGTYRGEFLLELLQMDVVATLPLAAGASFRDGSYGLMIRDAELTESVLKVTASVSGVRTMFDVRHRPTYVAFVRRRDTGPAVSGVPTRVRHDVLMPGLGGVYDATGMLGFSVAASVFQFARSPRPTGPEVIDERWLGDAELVIIRTRYQGAVRRTLEIADVQLQSTMLRQP